MVDQYKNTSESAAKAERDVAALLHQQNFQKSYPDDYLYHPMNDKNGKPLIVQVGDQYLFGMAKRHDGQEGGAFDQVVLLTLQELDQVYWQRPDAKSDSADKLAKYVDYEAVDAQGNPVAVTVESEDSKIKANAESYLQNTTRIMVGRMDMVSHPAGRAKGYLPAIEIDQDAVSKIGNVALAGENELKIRNEIPEDKRLTSGDVKKINDITLNSGIAGEQLTTNPYMAAIIAKQTAGVQAQAVQREPVADAVESAIKNSVIVDDVMQRLNQLGDAPDSKKICNIAISAVNGLNDAAKNQGQFHHDASQLIEAFRERGFSAQADIIESYAQENGSPDAYSEAQGMLRDLRNSAAVAEKENYASQASTNIDTRADMDASKDADVKVQEATERLKNIRSNALDISNPRMAATLTRIADNFNAKVSDVINQGADQSKFIGPAAQVLETMDKIAPGASDAICENDMYKGTPISLGCIK